MLLFFVSNVTSPFCPPLQRPYFAWDITGKRIRTSPILLDFQGVSGFVLIITYGHSCASLLINAGFTLKDVQEWMGHADIKMTANIYGHLDVSRKQTMAAKLAGDLSAPC